MTSPPIASAPPPCLVVFDCDGTLVDSQHAITAAMAEAFLAQDLPEPAAGAVRGVVGLQLSEAVARLHPEGDAESHRRLVECYRAAFAAARHAGTLAEPLFAGARAVIESLDAAGYLLGIATGKSRRGLLATLDRHGLNDRFVTLQTADDGPGKPHPDMIERAMIEVGAVPARTAVVGDTTFDIEMARNAGAKAVGVAWGYHEVGALMEAGAHRILDSFADLPAVIATLMTETQAPRPTAPLHRG